MKYLFESSTTSDKTNISINWKRILIVLLFGVTFICCYGQYVDDDPYSEKYFGTQHTKRNYPNPHFKADSTIAPCRKLTKVDDIFFEPNHLQDISEALKKPFEKLSEGDKYDIAINAWHTRDTGLFKIVLQSALNDTGKNMRIARQVSIQCLSRYNCADSKNTLLELLKTKDYECAMLAALALVQLDEKNVSFKYIRMHYSEHMFKEKINTALMRINSPESIQLLMKISEDKDPSQALDALGALSLLGYCDFAFKGFTKYTKSNIWQVRYTVAWCLAYYIGTPEANRIVFSMKNDDDDSVVQEIEKICKIYNLEK